MVIPMYLWKDIIDHLECTKILWRAINCNNSLQFLRVVRFISFIPLLDLTTLIRNCFVAFEALHSNKNNHWYNMFMRRVKFLRKRVFLQKCSQLYQICTWAFSLFSFVILLPEPRMNNCSLIFFGKILLNVCCFV